MKAHFESALKIQPDNPAALNNIAFYLAENGGNLDEALRLAQRAIQKAGAGFLRYAGLEIHQEKHA